jgi:hypothetical protein
MAKRARDSVPTVRELEWSRVLAEHERSGLSVAEFARRRGISAGSLGWWRHVARRRSAEPRGAKARATRGRAERDRFVEVRVAPARGEIAVDAMRGLFEVVVPGGCVVRVPAHFEADALRRVLAVLGTRC